MKKLNLYIVKQLTVSFLLVTFSLMSILWLTQSLRFVELITNKGLPVSIFLELTSLLMPRLFAIISPIAVFIATLFVYNKMLSDRELVVVKAAGVSHFQIAKPTIYFGLVISLFCFYVSNVGIPSAEKAFSELEWKVKNNVSHLMFKSGEFNTLQNNFTIFITSHEKDGSVSGILINDDRKDKVRSTVSAEKGRVVYTDEGPRIILINGVRQEINERTNQFVSVSFDRYSVDFGNFGSAKKKDEKAREKTLGELLLSYKDKSLTEKERNKFFVEGNKRLSASLYNLLFALIACTGLIVGNFNRRGQVKIICLSTAVMVLIQSGDLAYTNMAAKNISLLSLYYANLFVPLLIALYLLLYYNPAKMRRKKTED
ncbi:MAG: LPS export ABC transporter permease LptF [Alphaproteobacteria bacterium]|nr:LPS export ABC transporter permease LptF [Alphaproteobacteria bacterium]